MYAMKRIITFLSFVIVISRSYILDKESPEKFVVLFSRVPDDSVYEKLETYDWIKLYQITPKTYIFRFTKCHCSNQTESVAFLKKTFQNLIIEIEKVKQYVHVIKSNASYLDKPRSEPLVQGLEESNLVCDRYYGMGIEDAWSRGFTGKGVVVAVTDVGINTDLIDIQPNIDDDLCFNFVNNSTDVTPEYFHSYKDTSTTDHGNRCASLIAAVKGNNVCSAGIAFNSTIVALKIFGVYKDIPHHIYVRSSSDMMARSHVYELQNIDIYSNSWGPSQPFSQINLDQREAINTSAKKGRRGLGAVHVFPVGPTGNELANNEHTITVSAVGQHGTVPRDAVISASVLTSGLLSGNNLTADSMMTTSFGNKCITSFAGVSAAAAQVAGMIALALEVKPLLTLADVQDLIVYSSDLSCLKMSENVSTNAAGLKFHPVFGFGLLNGTKLVDRANEMKEGLEISEQSLRQITACDNKTHGYIADFCYNCNPNTGDFILTTGCLYAVKTAKIQFMYRTSARQMRISLISPNGTVSILQDFSSDSLQTGSTGRKQILTSVHFWDEDASGLWRFKLQSDGHVDVIGNVSLSLFGVVSDVATNRPSLKETDCALTCSGHVLDSGHSDSHGVVTTGVIVAVVAVASVVFIAIMIYIKSKHRNSQSGVPMIENGGTSAESQSPLMNQRVNSETFEETAMSSL